MKFIKAIFAKFFKDPVDGTMSTTKGAVFTAFLAALWQVFKDIPPDQWFARENIVKIVLILSGLFFGGGLKDAIAKSSVQSINRPGLPVNPPTPIPPADKVGG